GGVIGEVDVARVRRGDRVGQAVDAAAAVVPRAPGVALGVGDGVDQPGAGVAEVRDAQLGADQAGEVAGAVVLEVAGAVVRGVARVLEDQPGEAAGAVVREVRHETQGGARGPLDLLQAGVRVVPVVGGVAVAVDDLLQLARARVKVDPAAGRLLLEV